MTIIILQIMLILVILQNNSTNVLSEYYDEEDKYNNIQVLGLPVGKKVYDDKNNVTHIRRFNMNGNNIIANSNNIKYNSEPED